METLPRLGPQPDRSKEMGHPILLSTHPNSVVLLGPISPDCERRPMSTKQTTEMQNWLMMLLDYITNPYNLDKIVLEYVCDMDKLMHEEEKNELQSN